MEVKTLPLDLIKEHDTLQPRYSINFVVVDDYAQAMDSGQPFPPVDVVYDGESYWLCDGYHRKRAADQLDWLEMTVSIIEGSFEDAQWLALAANKTHGFQRSNQDKRRAVELAFEHPKGRIRSDHQIADHCGVSHKLAGKIRSTRNGSQSPIRQGRDGRIYNTANIGKHPTTALTPEVRQAMLETDIDQNIGEQKQLAKVAPEWQRPVLDILARGEAKTITQAKRVFVHQQKIPPQPIEGKYRVFYADPPWPYNDSGFDDYGYGYAERYYPTMSIDEICGMGDDIKTASDENAVLFLWVTSPLLEDGFKVINAWGFKYKTSFVWDKIRHNHGHYNSVRHELLLICTRGSCTPDVAKLFDSVQSIERSNTHSEKPEQFRQIIDTLYTHGNKIELFARNPADGWQIWSNEPDVKTA